MLNPVMVGQDPIVRKVTKLTERLARTTHPIFIEGEAGVGREHLARFLHARGPRAAAPFSVVDFGDAARGAWLDELVAKREEAPGGTLLIKGCERIPLADMGSAVRMLMEASDSTRVVMAASRLDPREVGGPLPELAERLGALPLFLPALRTRRADIPELVHYLLDRDTRDRQGGGLQISESAMLALWCQDWPGNVRQLRDALVDGASRVDGTLIGPRHLALGSRGRSRGGAAAGVRILSRSVPNVGAAFSVV